MQAIRGEVSVYDFARPIALVVDDSADADGRTAILDVDQTLFFNNMYEIRGLAPVPIHYRASNLKSLTLYGGTRDDTFNVRGTAAGTSLTIDAGGGNDTINVGSPGNTLDTIQ